jgi:hypothetical protein
MFTTGSRSTITPYHKAEFRKLMVFHEQALRSGANQRECVPISVGKRQDLEPTVILVTVGSLGDLKMGLHEALLSSWIG